MAQVNVATTQMACSDQRQSNLDAAEELVREAAGQGALIVLLQELFETRYFCQVEKADFFSLARTMEENPVIHKFSKLAAELRVVLPISFFEKKGQTFFNSLVVIDADGQVLGVYRKTHIPDGPGYEEKFYFSPGDTGFRVWKTRYATIGVGICWDQWFPETARAMVLMGAEILLFPTAIGSEPANPAYDSQPHWQLCMQGHSAANMIPVVAANRIGEEIIDGSSLSFYGSSFITDNRGNLLTQCDRQTPGVIVAELDLDTYASERAAWGLFRDRRPEMYAQILTLDGSAGKQPSK